MRDRTSLRTLNQLPTFPTAPDALHANGLAWDVELEPLTTASGKTAPGRAVVRADTREPLGVVGLGYHPVSNDMATRWLDQYVPHGLRITGAESFKAGRRNVMYGFIGSEPAEVQRGDLVALQLVVAWSHDGSSSTTARLRALRMVCTNGLVLASDAGQLFSVRHTRNGDLETETIQGQVREALGRFGESIDAFRGLASRPVTRPQVREYVRQAMGFDPDASGELSGRSRNVLDSIVQRFDDSRQVAQDLAAAHREHDGRQAEANAALLDSIVEHFDAGRGQQLNGGGTWWQAYNAVTEHLTHERGRTAESRQESLLFGTSSRLNERALGLALNASGVA